MMQSKENPYSEIFKQLETALLDHDLRVETGLGLPYRYDDIDFMACINVFSHALMWRAWEHMENKDEKPKIAKMIGVDLRDFIIKHTGIDTRTLWAKTMTDD